MAKRRSRADNKAVLFALGLVLATQKSTAEFAAWTITYVEQGDICISSGDGRFQRTVAKDGSMPTWSPNKKRVAFARGKQVWVVDRDGRNQRCIYKSKRKDGGLWGISWGKGLAPGRVWEVGQLRKETPKESILIADDDRVFHVAVQEPGYEPAEEFEPINPPMEATLFAPTISQDGRQVAVSVEGDVWLAWTDSVKAKEAAMRQNNGASEGWEFSRIAALADYDMPSYRVSRENNYVRELDWAPNGRALACGYHRFGGSGLSQIIMLRFARGKSPYDQFFKGIRQEVIANDAVEPDFSPDGKWILCSSVWGSTGLMAISLDGRTRHNLIAGADQGDW